MSELTGGGHGIWDQAATVESLGLITNEFVTNRRRAERGKIQKIGTPLELHETPANRFVAQFIGSPTMNVLELPAEGGLKLDNDARIAGNGAARHLGIRPEHFRIVPAGQGDITVEAQVIEHLGSDTNIYAESEHLGPLLVRAHGYVDLRPGDRCGLIFDREKLHLFGQDEGRFLATTSAAAPS